jgi:hypothetical protein
MQGCTGVSMVRTQYERRYIYQDDTSDETDFGAHKASAPIPHACGAMMRPVVLHASKGVLYMLWLQRRSCFGRSGKERTRRECKLFSIAVCVLAAAFIRSTVPTRRRLAFEPAIRRVGVREDGVLQRPLHFQSGQGQGADHFKGKESDDVNGVVTSFQAEMCRQI